MNTFFVVINSMFGLLARWGYGPSSGRSQSEPASMPLAENESRWRMLGGGDAWIGQCDGSLFGSVDLEERISARHPLSKIRAVVNDALHFLDAEFDQFYAREGRPSFENR